MTTHTHGNWDQSGYCNNLLLDENGDGNSCGYQKGPVHNHGPEDGPGLACNETYVDGVLRGWCVIRQEQELIEQLIHKCARLQGIPVEHERLNWVLPTNKFRVWYVPQIPMEGDYADVGEIEMWDEEYRWEDFTDHND